MGTFGATEVYAFGTPGAVVTGDFSAVADIHIGVPPLPICVGETPCPGGNDGDPGEGCENSLGYGASLEAVGTVSVANDDMVFHFSQGRNGQPGVMVHGSTIISLPFKDGVLCAGASSEKETRFAAVAAGNTALGLPPLEVVMFIGDNIKDCPGQTQARHDPGMFGTRCFILPNPMYGSWVARHAAPPGC